MNALVSSCRLVDAQFNVASCWPQAQQLHADSTELKLDADQDARLQHQPIMWEDEEEEDDEDFVDDEEELDLGDDEDEDFFDDDDDEDLDDEEELLDEDE